MPRKRKLEEPVESASIVAGRLRSEAVKGELRGELARSRVSQRDLAARLGVSSSVITYVLRGRQGREPGALPLHLFLAVCQELGVDAAQVLARTAEALPALPREGPRARVEAPLDRVFESAKRDRGSELDRLSLVVEDSLRAAARLVEAIRLERASDPEVEALAERRMPLEIKRGQGRR